MQHTKKREEKQNWMYKLNFSINFYRVFPEKGDKFLDKFIIWKSADYFRKFLFLLHFSLKNTRISPIVIFVSLQFVLWRNNFDWKFLTCWYKLFESTRMCPDQLRAHSTKRPLPLYVKLIWFVLIELENDLCECVQCPYHIKIYDSNLFSKIIFSYILLVIYISCVVSRPFSIDWRARRFVPICYV